MKIERLDNPDNMTMADILYWCVISNYAPQYQFIEGKLYRKGIKL